MKTILLILTLMTLAMSIAVAIKIHPELISAIQQTPAERERDQTIAPKQACFFTLKDGGQAIEECDWDGKGVYK